ncbi:MAG TPA: hypothetical protein VL094_04930 [Sphingomonadaceae bacterium]|nr:hypothetical protein [Sphingomonadaceae bacterium]
MRGAMALLLCLGLLACGEPDFDQRYSEQERQISNEAAAMEAELDRRMSEKPGMETPEATGSSSK